MRTTERHAIARAGLKSLPLKRAAHRLEKAGVRADDLLAHINAREALLLRRVMPEAQEGVVTKGKLARAGRRGDTVVTRLLPAERKLLKKHGGSGTRNPASGLLEYGDGMGGSDNPGGGHNGDQGPGGVGGPSGPGHGGVGPGSSPGGGGYSGVGGNTAFSDFGFFNTPEDEIGGPGVGKRGVGFDPENNPEMGGGRSRAAGLASVGALGPSGRGVHAASSVMAGLNPSFTDRANDFIGDRAPGGFLGSPAANLGATIAGGLVGGPWGAAAANVAHSVTLGGRSLADVAPSAVGGFFAGGLGSMAAQAAADGLRGKESYESAMSLADIDAKATAGTSRNGTTPGAPGDPGSNPGMNDGAGAGTAYVMAPPEAAPAPATVSAASAAIVREETEFLSRHPEVAQAVKDGVWTSGRAFNQAYKAQTGVSYDAARGVGLVSPPAKDMLAARTGEAVPYRG
jgi:hypothetical protein